MVAWRCWQVEVEDFAAVLAFQEADLDRIGGRRGERGFVDRDHDAGEGAHLYANHPALRNVPQQRRESRSDLGWTQRLCDSH